MPGATGKESLFFFLAINVMTIIMAAAMVIGSSHFDFIKRMGQSLLPLTAIAIFTIVLLCSSYRPDAGRNDLDTWQQPGLPIIHYIFCFHFHHVGNYCAVHGHSYIANAK